MNKRIKYNPNGGPESWRERYLEDPLHSRIIEVTCPNGHPAHIHIENRSNPGKNWKIDVDGEVSPSILCLTPLPDKTICNWHVMAHLENWRPEWNQ